MSAEQAPEGLTEGQRALAEVWSDQPSGVDCQIARGILASDWLANHVRAAIENERERIAQAIEAKNLAHGTGCLCLVCESFTECVAIARADGAA